MVERINKSTIVMIVEYWRGYAPTSSPGIYAYGGLVSNLTAARFRYEFYKFSKRSSPTKFTEINVTRGMSQVNMMYVVYVYFLLTFGIAISEFIFLPQMKAYMHIFA